MKYFIIILFGCYRTPIDSPPVVVKPKPTYMQHPMPNAAQRSASPKPPHVHPNSPNVVWVWIGPHYRGNKLVKGHWEQRVLHPTHPKPKPKKKH